MLAKRSASLTALTSGGAIPEVADYRVVLDPDELFIGTLNEDFAIESNAGDIFQLGNSSWRILHVGGGVVRVADAHGAPPTIPFWLGEAPARSDELSDLVSDLRRGMEPLLPSAAGAGWLIAESGVSRDAAAQISDYLSESLRILGALPTADTIVLERFFDDGGMQLVLHAPFGSRVNRAWALALRKRFCRQFNFELQAAATEEGRCCRSGRSTRSRWPTCSATCIRRACATSSSRRFSMRRCSRRAGAGMPPSHSPSRA